MIRGGEVRVPGHAEPIELEPFYISKFPISNLQYEAFDPDYIRAPTSDGDREAAVGLTYFQAEAYCRWYAQVAGKPFRIPTEIEWAHACQFGSEGRYYFDEDEDPDDYIRHRGNSEGRAGDPEEKKANKAGLHGMLGGTWDWTASHFEKDPATRQEPVPPESQAWRTVRGGSFRTKLSEINCQLRKGADPNKGYDDVGFRIIKYLRA